MSDDEYTLVQPTGQLGCTRCGVSYPEGDYHDCPRPPAQTWVDHDKCVSDGMERLSKLNEASARTETPREKITREMLTEMRDWLRNLTWHTTGRLPEQWEG